MIKLFRNIRRNLLNEGKTSRYFKYAIGEVVLVVIGILIAVQINNWNEGRSRSNLEIVLLKQLKKELLIIYDDLIFDFDALKLGEDSHYKILDYIEKDAPYEGSMCFDFYLINYDEYIYPKAAVYDKIKDEGLDIIGNDTIRHLTQHIYESMFPRISRGNSFKPDISEYFKDYYQNNFKPNKDYSLVFNHSFAGDTISGIIYPGELREYPVVSVNKGQQKITQLGMFH